MTSVSNTGGGDSFIWDNGEVFELMDGKFAKVDQDKGLLIIYEDKNTPKFNEQGKPIRYKIKLGNVHITKRNTPDAFTNEESKKRSL